MKRIFTTAARPHMTRPRVWVIGARACARTSLVALCLLALVGLSACAPKHAGDAAGQSAAPPSAQSPATAGREQTPAGQPGFGSQAVGQVVAAHAGATLERAGASVAPASNLPVLAGDRLHSGPHGPMQMLLEDGGTLTFAPGTTASFAGADAGASNAARAVAAQAAMRPPAWPIIHMDTGLLRLVSGGAGGVAGAKPPASAARIHTPHALVDMGPGIVTLRVEANSSTVYVEHATEPVLVNGSPVVQGYKLTVPGK